MVQLILSSLQRLKHLKQKRLSFPDFLQLLDNTESSTIQTDRKQTVPSAFPLLTSYTCNHCSGGVPPTAQEVMNLYTILLLLAIPGLVPSCCEGHSGDEVSGEGSWEEEGWSGSTDSSTAEDDTFTGFDSGSSSANETHDDEGPRTYPRISRTYSNKSFVTSGVGEDKGGSHEDDGSHSKSHGSRDQGSANDDFGSNMDLAKIGDAIDVMKKLKKAKSDQEFAKKLRSGPESLGVAFKTFEQLSGLWISVMHRIWRVWKAKGAKVVMHSIVQDLMNSTGRAIKKKVGHMLSKQTVVDSNGSGSATFKDEGSTEPEQSHHPAIIHKQRESDVTIIVPNSSHASSKHNESLKDASSNVNLTRRLPTHDLPVERVSIDFIKNKSKEVRTSPSKKSKLKYVSYQFYSQSTDRMIPLISTFPNSISWCYKHAVAIFATFFHKTLNIVTISLSYEGTCKKVKVSLSSRNANDSKPIPKSEIQRQPNHVSEQSNDTVVQETSMDKEKMNITSKSENSSKTVASSSMVLPNVKTATTLVKDSEHASRTNHSLESTDNTKAPSVSVGDVGKGLEENVSHIDTEVTQKVTHQIAENDVDHKQSNVTEKSMLVKTENSSVRKGDAKSQSEVTKIQDTRIQNSSININGQRNENSSTPSKILSQGNVTISRRQNKAANKTGKTRVLETLKINFLKRTGLRITMKSSVSQVNALETRRNAELPVQQMNQILKLIPQEK
ncbi:hypothetical protein OS493_011119 [Desmophyllum pertusum]|uniref:Uncharacterized protein n=1 Tax=Desmophyllum pertusum TaxID=174260 RepID=A0A9W9Z381_9CNID|nr:hypothetical protein OS493_011119 [Desmophyllum pertusum]